MRTRWLVGICAGTVASLALPLGMGASGIGVSSMGVSSAGAAGPPTLALDWTVHASTHLAKLNQTVTVPPGTFKGTINLATGQLKGNLTLPKATTTITLAGLVPAAQATFLMKEAKPITGHVDLSTFRVTTTASFNIKVVRATAPGVPVNLVGNNCQTSTPVTVKMSGKANLTGSTTFSSTYTIPPLVHCRGTTAALNLLVAGGGNTFTATFAPAS